MFDKVENIVGKGENAGYQHFLLFPRCFQKARLQDRENPGLFCKAFNLKGHENPHLLTEYTRV